MNIRSANHDCLHPQEVLLAYKIPEYCEEFPEQFLRTFVMSKIACFAQPRVQTPKNDQFMFSLNTERLVFF